jgi:hypothetical protein
LKGTYARLHLHQGLDVTGYRQRPATAHNTRAIRATWGYVRPAISWFLIAWILAGTQMLGHWYDKRCGGPLPPRPAQHGRELEGGQDNGPGGDLTVSEAQCGGRARHLPDAGVIQWAWRSLPGCQPGRRPARLEVSA